MSTILSSSDEMLGNEQSLDDKALNENKALICSYLARRMKGESVSLSELSQQAIETAEGWFQQFLKLRAEAVELAYNNVPRGGCEFDDLKQRRMRLADEYFDKKNRGIPFSYVSQAFDSISKGVLMWQRYPYCPNEDKALLLEIQKFASWNDSSVKLKAACEEFDQKYPNSYTLKEMAILNGKLIKRLKKDASNFGKNNDEIGFKDAIRGAKLDEVKDAYFIKKLKEEFEKAKTGKENSSRWRNMIEQQKNKTKSTSVKSSSKLPSFNKENPDVNLKTSAPEAGHPNSILTLAPSKKWTIVSDETAVVENRPEALKYVFVLVPDSVQLSTLNEKWHASELSPETIIAVTDEIYNSGVGVIGIPAAGLNKTNGDYWYPCLEALLDITLRLLPIDGETEIELNIEQQDQADRKSSLGNLVCDSAMYRLSLVNPERAKLIQLKVKYINKDDCQLNGYADAVAYSWGCAKDKRKFFKDKYGWVGPCLIEGSTEVATAFRRCLDLVYRGEPLLASDWASLLSANNGMAVGSLVGVLLRTYGEEARRDIKKWKTYLNYTLSHLNSKAIKLFLLKPELEWLKEYEPNEVTLPPRLRLLWLTVQLASSNHIGGTDFGSQKYEDEFKALSCQLKLEDAPLVCFAALHLAVELTDAYQFEEAKKLLLPWEAESPAVPGLRYYAYVISSLGQHAAFLGENELALEYFIKALKLIDSLSEDKDSDLEQTSAYAVIAAMDCSAPAFEKMFSRYLYGGEWTTEKMIDVAKEYSSIDDAEHKYHHAILLRYLVSLPEDNPIREAYISNAEEWAWSTDGHPWELIAFYRALLLQDNDPMRKEWLKRGYELCLGEGPTLQAIASVIGAARMAAGEMATDEYLAKVEEAIAMLPALGETRISALRKQVESPLPILELACIVLPFNFR